MGVVLDKCCGSEADSFRISEHGRRAINQRAINSRPRATRNDDAPDLPLSVRSTRGLEMDDMIIGEVGPNHLRRSSSFCEDESKQEFYNVQ